MEGTISAFSTICKKNWESHILIYRMLQSCKGCRPPRPTVRYGSSIHNMLWCIRYYNPIWWHLSETCDRSVVFSEYSGFLHEKNKTKQNKTKNIKKIKEATPPPPYNWYIKCDNKHLRYIQSYSNLLFNMCLCSWKEITTIVKLVKVTGV